MLLSKYNFSLIGFWDQPEEKYNERESRTKTERREKRKEINRERELKKKGKCGRKWVVDGTKTHA